MYVEASGFYSCRIRVLVPNLNDLKLVLSVSFHKVIYRETLSRRGVSVQ